MTLTEFLLARIAEDEERARVGALYPEEHTGWIGGRVGGSYVGFADRFNPARVLAECEAKRRIMVLHDDSHECSTYELGGGINNCTWVLSTEDCSTVRVLAAVYAEHPDYDDEWRP